MNVLQHIRQSETDCNPTAGRRRLQTGRSPIPEWTIVLSLPLLAGAGYLTHGYSAMVVLTWLLLGANILLLWVVCRDAMKSGLIGKVLLVSASIAFFWLDAFTLASQPLPFQTPFEISQLGLQVGTGLLQESFVYIALFQCALFAGYAAVRRPRKIVAWSSGRVDSKALRHQYAPFLFALLGLVPLLISHNGNISSIFSDLLKSRSTGKTGLSFDNTSYLNNVLYDLGLFGTALLLIRAATSSVKQRGWYLAVGLSTSAIFILSGARTLLMYAVLPVLAIVLAQSRLHRRSKLLPIILAVVVLVVMQVQVVLRAKSFSDAGAVTAGRVLDPSVTHQFSALLFAEYLVPAQHPPYHELMEPYFLTHFVPRALWPGKPESKVQSDFTARYSRGIKGSNYTPTAIGQFHMSWGPLGVVAIGFWLGILTSVADKIFNSLKFINQSAMAATVGMLYVFIGSSFRLYHPYYFTYVVVGAGAMSAMTKSRKHGSFIISARPTLTRRPGAALR